MSSLADAVEIAPTADEDAAIGHCRRSLARIAKITDAQHLELRPGLEDVTLAAASEVDVPILRGKGTRRHGNAGQTLRPDLLPIGQVAASHRSGIVQAIEILADCHWGAEAFRYLGDLPLAMGRGDIAFPGRIDGDARPAAAAVAIDYTPGEHRRYRIADACLVAGAARPERVAGSWIESLHCGRRADQQLRLALDLGQSRRAVRPLSVGAFLLPFQFAGLL